MLKKAKVLVFALLMLFSTFSVVAQTQEDLQKLVFNIKKSANDTATIEGGKLKSVELTIPDVGEKLFTFEWANDGRSFVMTSDTNERFQIHFNEENEIQSIKLPNDEIVNVIWTQADGVSLMDDAVIGSGSNAVSLLRAQGPGDCQAAVRAFRDSVIAAGIACFFDPGSAGCYAAVAYAGVMAWRVRQACGPAS